MLLVCAGAQLVGGLQQAVTHALQALGVFDHFTDQLIKGVEKVVKAFAHFALGAAAVAEVDLVIILSEFFGGLHQRSTFNGFRVCLHGEIDQNCAFHHHIQRM